MRDGRAGERGKTGGSCFGSRSLLSLTFFCPQIKGGKEEKKGLTGDERKRRENENGEKGGEHGDEKLKKGGGLARGR